ncbi:hypothetical protein GGR71_001669 [Xanthomonas sp. F1]
MRCRCVQATAREPAELRSHRKPSGTAASVSVRTIGMYGDGRWPKVAPWRRPQCNGGNRCRCRRRRWCPSAELPGDEDAGRSGSCNGALRRFVGASRQTMPFMDRRGRRSCSRYIRVGASSAAADAVKLRSAHRVARNAHARQLACDLRWPLPRQATRLACARWRRWMAQFLRITRVSPRAVLLIGADGPVVPRRPDNARRGAVADSGGMAVGAAAVGSARRAANSQRSAERRCRAPQAGDGRAAPAIRAH